MANYAERESDSLRRRRVQYRIRLASDRIVSFLQVFVAVAGLIVVLLFNVPWLSGPLKDIGLSNTTALTGSIIMVVVVSVFFDVRSVTAGSPDPVVRHFSDPMDVYPVLIERIKSISRPEEKVLDIIGMTLYTAWPSVRFWLNRSELIGWKVRMAAVSSHSGFSHQVPETWYLDAKNNLDSIEAFAVSSTAQANNISLQAFGYDFTPALHGYRLGNGDLFYSILTWKDDGKISIDGYSYEFVPNNDRSPSAEAIRQVFNSWFTRAIATPWASKAV